MGKKNINYTLLLFLFGLILFPKFIFAASVYFTSTSQNIYPGDIFIVDAHISSADQEINVADGAFSFNPQFAEITELSTGGSIFSIWAQQPTFSNTKGEVSFAGGTPEGFSQENGLIVRAIFRAKVEGELTLAFHDAFSLYLNDGKGSVISPDKRPLILSISKRPAGSTPADEWQTIITKDAISPEFSEAQIGRNPALYGNKYFVSFLATDEGSGVAYYEIKEGDRDFARVESPYLLKDQTLKDSVLLKVVDKAGNEGFITPSVPTPTSQPGIYILWVFLALLGMIALFGIGKKLYLYERK